MSFWLWWRRSHSPVFQHASLLKKRQDRESIRKLVLFWFQPPCLKASSIYRITNAASQKVEKQHHTMHCRDPQIQVPSHDETRSLIPSITHIISLSFCFSVRLNAMSIGRLRQMKTRRLLLGLEVVEEDGALLGLLTPVLDDDARAVDNLAGVPLTVEDAYQITSISS